MFSTTRAFFKIAAYLLRTKKSLTQARKFEREGKISERDAIVNQLVPDWARYVVSTTGSSVEIVGAEHVPTDTAVVFVGNHQGYFDIPILLGFVPKPKAFISKIEILKVPVLSGWMEMMQCTFLDRKNMRQSIKAMDEAVQTVKKGYSLVIFPEGTRSRGGPVAEFKAGSFKLAVKAGVPIVPVTIDGSWRIYEGSKKVAPAHVRVTLHEPIPTANISREELQSLAERTRAVIVSKLEG